MIPKRYLNKPMAHVTARLADIFRAVQVDDLNCLRSSWPLIIDMSAGVDTQPLQIPTVTEVCKYRSRCTQADSNQDDLRRFHAEHFPHAPLPLSFFEVPDGGDDDQDDDDDLGYYPDGTKRTLTDDQLAMFRHSEIQELLRKRRLAQEQQEQEASDGELHEEEENVDKSLKRTRPEDFVPYGMRAKKKKKRRPRRDRDRPKKKPPTKSDGTPGDTAGNHEDFDDEGAEGEDLMPRRIAREQDEQSTVWAGLEYD